MDIVGQALRGGALPAAPLLLRRQTALVVRLAQRLPAAPPGTRVLPPERLWQAARASPDAADAVLSDWLGRP